MHLRKLLMLPREGLKIARVLLEAFEENTSLLSVGSAIGQLVSVLATDLLPAINGPLVTTLSQILQVVAQVAGQLLSALAT
ncbi:hypothetical protein [Streptomyces sp. RKCA744]|uniref:hypothetical protein n=1 Tax=Streptomyces sp. RKCA744 TaxID=2959340 RepID=UPI00209E064A|nr:hypothetical protein [Streptomyces sp. RKCA744]MCO8308556.1 hypothetical protein [Streptomyces sp. RKCA744]